MCHEEAHFDPNLLACSPPPCAGAVVAGCLPAHLCAMMPPTTSTAMKTKHKMHAIRSLRWTCARIGPARMNTEAGRRAPTWDA